MNEAIKVLKIVRAALAKKITENNSSDWRTQDLIEENKGLRFAIRIIDLEIARLNNLLILEEDQEEE